MLCKRAVCVTIATVVAFAYSAPVAASSITFYLSDEDNFPGLSAEVQFTLPRDATTLIIRARNTSTGVPDGFSNSDQILTGISWDFGHPGYNGDALITGGGVVIGPDSETINFDTGWYGPGANVSGEWGYGNEDGTGALTNFISSNTPQATPFGGPNLDGPDEIDGPQGGLVADPLPVPLGGIGAIQDEIIATLTLSQPIADLDFLVENLVRIEFGSDAAWITVPEPTSLSLLLVGMGVLIGRCRRRRA